VYDDPFTGSVADVEDGQGFFEDDDAHSVNGG
jgi:hypothetical protein